MVSLEPMRSLPVSLELIVATVVVSYVAIRYLAFYQPHKVLVGSR
ncbi:hypothetical protein [Vibrio cholerae]|nr:hypothetical protein [Vibrio cholerae]